MNIEDLTKQRIDFEELPGGGARATLTVTLNDGSVHRFVEEVTATDLDAFAGALAAGEGDAVEGVFGDLFRAVKKGVKAVGHVAKKVVTSKVFQVASGVLATAAFGPAGLAAASALSVASKLATADVAKAAGAPKAARKLVKAAAVDASKRARGNPAATKDLLRIANDKRKNVARLIGGATGAGPSRRAPSSPPPAPARKAPSSTQLLDAARQGKLRSNRPGGVSPSELLSAAKSGRVFWTAAA